MRVCLAMVIVSATTQKIIIQSPLFFQRVFDYCWSPVRNHPPVTLQAQ
ncbi:MAG: hypothetical protein HW380_3931 [Magnetococcales bacterium]|nr:hypothetical protein [Magnetococcales bacterium]